MPFEEADFMEEAGFMTCWFSRFHPTFKALLQASGIDVEHRSGHQIAMDGVVSYGTGEAILPSKQSLLYIYIYMLNCLDDSVAGPWLPGIWFAPLLTWTRIRCQS